MPAADPDDATIVRRQGATTERADDVDDEDGPTIIDLPEDQLAATDGICRQ